MKNKKQFVLKSTLCTEGFGRMEFSIPDTAKKGKEEMTEELRQGRFVLGKILYEIRKYVKAQENLDMAFTFSSRQNSDEKLLILNYYLNYSDTQNLSIEEYTRKFTNHFLRIAKTLIEKAINEFCDQDFLYLRDVKCLFEQKKPMEERERDVKKYLCSFMSQFFERHASSEERRQQLLEGLA